MEKKEYETPSVTRVEIDFSDRIIAGTCTMNADTIDCTVVGYEAS